MSRSRTRPPSTGHRLDALSVRGPGGRRALSERATWRTGPSGPSGRPARAPAHTRRAPALILPMVEGRCADHEVKGLVGIGQALRHPAGETDAGVVRHERATAIMPSAASIPASSSTSGRRSARSRRSRPVPHPTSSTRRGTGSSVERDVRRAEGYVVVHTTAPSALVVRGPIVKRLNVSVIGHVLTRRVLPRPLSV